MTLHLPVDSAGDIIERLSHQDRWRATGKLDHFDSAPDITARFIKCFAMLASNQEGNLIEILFEQIGESKHDAGALYYRSISPGGKSFLRRLDCQVDRLLITFGGKRDHLASRRVINWCVTRSSDCNCLTADKVV